MSRPDCKGYQWPADRLTAHEMAVLHTLRGQTGLPINALLKLAMQVLAGKSPVEINQLLSQNDRMKDEENKSKK
ncbi:hypothetical protein KC734_07670 [candidate division KSB1 bacterium]|nr:hypothetical protein [candidate division KSB1 bacterium]